MNLLSSPWKCWQYYQSYCCGAQSRWEGTIFIDCLPCAKFYARCSLLHDLKRNKKSLWKVIIHLNITVNGKTGTYAQISLVPKALCFFYLFLYSFSSSPLLLQYPFDTLFESWDKHCLFCKTISDSPRKIYMFLSLRSYRSNVIPLGFNYLLTTKFVGEGTMSFHSFMPSISPGC